MKRITDGRRILRVGVPVDKVTGVRYLGWPWKMWLDTRQQSVEQHRYRTDGPWIIDFLGTRQWRGGRRVETGW